MPISKRIITEIEALDVTDKERDLLLSILELEDNGIRNYKKQYKEELRRFTGNVGEE